MGSLGLMGLVGYWSSDIGSIAPIGPIHVSSQRVAQCASFKGSHSLQSIYRLNYAKTLLAFPR
jgi:hypothetical protein